MYGHMHRAFTQRANFKTVISLLMRLKSDRKANVGMIFAASMVAVVPAIGVAVDMSREVRFKTAQVYDYKNDPNQLIPENKKYSRYRRDDKGEYEFRNALDNHCWRLWHATVITWDGLVVPCCFDKDAQHPLGDLKGRPFKEVWHNEQYVTFRRQILLSRKNIDICANCSEGTRVWGE